MYSVPTGLRTLAAADEVGPRWTPDDGEGDLDLVALEGHTGDGSDLDAVNGDDVSGGKASGIGEVRLVGGVVVDKGKLGELQRPDDEDGDDHDSHQSRHRPIAFAESLHEQLAVWVAWSPMAPEGRVTGFGILVGGTHPRERGRCRAGPTR